MGYAGYAHHGNLTLFLHPGYASEPKSSIIVIGLSVHTAPVAVRERLSIPEALWPSAIAQLCAYPHVEEAAVLSTCNRLEVYVVGLSYHRAVREVEQFLAARSGVPLAELQQHLFLLRDRDATNHLLRVSAGLDSLVLGEGQILAQVKAVHASGEKAPGLGRHLSGLFKAAITAGKRVRTETSIASGAVSVSSAAAELAAMKLPARSFEGARVCIVGAGKMSRLLVKHLLSKGCDTFTLVNRSASGAEALAAEFPEAKVTIRLADALLQSVAEADVVFTASSSDEPLLTAANTGALPRASGAVGGVRRFFDIAVPRNVDADVATVAGAALFNVDDLKEVVDTNLGARLAAAEAAKELLEQERTSFEAWRDSLETVPTIKKLRAKAEAIRASEVEKACKVLGLELSKKQRKVMEELSRGITNKLLHGPMQALRSDGTDAQSVSATLVNMHALERMFDLAAADAAESRATAALGSALSDV